MPDTIRSSFFCACFGYCLLIPLFSFAAAEQDSIRQNLQDDWLIFNSRYNTYAPYIHDNSQVKRSFSFIINKEKAKNSYLAWCFQKGTTLFIEQQIVGFYNRDDCMRLDLDSLFTVYGRNDLFFTIYNKSLDFDRFKTYLTSKNQASAQANNGSLLKFSLRSDPGFKNFYLVTLLLFLIFLSMVYNLNPKNFKEYYNLNKTFSLRLRYENIASLKIFNWSNLLILFAHCLLISFLLMVILNLMDNPVPFLKIQIEGLFAGIWRWIMLAFVILFLVLAKYFLIKVLTAMMNLKELDNIHFFEFIRFSIFIYSVSLIFVCILLLAYYIPPAEYFLWIIYLTASLSVVRIILLYLKFLRLSTFRNLYLFSYLCTTEILPFIIGVKIFVLNF